MMKNLMLLAVLAALAGCAAQGGHSEVYGQTSAGVAVQHSH